MTMKVRYTTIDGEVIAEERNGVRSLYSPDALGSTMALIDNTQTKTDAFTYWPYGETRVHTGTNPTPLQYVGTQGYFTDSSKRSHVRARPLDTQRGRWVTQDPIGFRGGDSNIYRYAGNSPLTRIDRSGTQIVSIGVIGGLIGGQLCFWIEYERLVLRIPFEGHSMTPRDACRIANHRCGTNIPCGLCLNIPPPGYGNYCGPGRDGHRFRDPIVNDLDQCCYDHDACFRDTVPGGSGTGFMGPEARKCNRALCACIILHDCRDTRDQVGCKRSLGAIAAFACQFS